MGEKESGGFSRPHEHVGPLPAQQLGSYEIRGKIGSGGMGDVYDAIHTGLQKRVAIKTLRKRFLDDEIVVQRFLREGQLASRIRHPNIVDVTDVGMMGGLPCLVMEHCEGESFSALIRREGKLSVDRIVDILLPIIAAVDFAHDHGIVHRDLKPSNIFLSRSWNGEIVPKVLDFGISKLVHEAQEAALTTDSAFVGTPHYASPESMRADRQADGRSDQYSTGVILYEAVTGTRPFVEQGNNFVALAMAICKGEYPPARDRNPDVPAAFDNVVRRSMALQPEDRFITMRALGEALLPFASERLRLIWTPTFQGQSSEVPIIGEFRPAGASSATVQMPSSIGSKSKKLPRPAAGSEPTFAEPQAYLDSSSAPVSTPSTTPPGAAFDRIPTYSGGSYGTNHPVAPPRGNGLIIGVVGASVVVAILAGVLILEGTVGGKHDGPALAASTLAPVVQATYPIDVAVSPTTATMEIDGIPLGVARVVQSLPKDGKKHVIRASAPGYESVLVSFDDKTPPPATIALRAVTPPPSTAAAPAPNRRGGSKKGSQPKTDNIDPWDDH